MGTKGADTGTHFQSLFRAQKLTQPSGTHQKWGWPLSSTIFCTERQGHQNLGTTHCTWLHLNFSALVISQFAHFCEEKKIGSKTYLLIFHWFKSTHSKIWINDDIFPVRWYCRVVNDQNHYLRLGPILKPKPKLVILSANTITNTVATFKMENLVTNIEIIWLLYGFFFIIKWSLKPNLLPNLKYF